MNIEVITLACSLAAMLFSAIAVSFSMYIYVRFESAEKSTHQIEFRDPYKQYDDELKVEKVPKVNGYTKGDEDMYDDETIDEMNKFIKDNGVML